MSALQAKKTNQRKIANDINLVYLPSEKPNNTQLKAHQDRAVVANLRADLVLPDDTIMTVDINFDHDSGYHNNTMLIMDDFGVEMLASALETKFGAEYATKVREAWARKEDANDPRKPTYMLVQKPQHDDVVPKIYVACGKNEENHDTDRKSPLSVI